MGTTEDDAAAGLGSTRTSLIPDEHLLAWRTLLNAHATLVREIEDALAAAGLPPFALVRRPLAAAP